MRFSSFLFSMERGEEMGLGYGFGDRVVAASSLSFLLLLLFFYLFTLMYICIVCTEGGWEGGRIGGWLEVSEGFEEARIE